MSDAHTDAAAPAPGADVLAVLHDLGLEPVSFTVVGGFPRWTAGRVTYRVQLADGDVVKVRCVVRPALPKRAAAIVRALDDPRVPAPIALEGRVTVEGWVDGRTLDAAPVSGRHLHAAADLLADLHSRAGLPGLRFRRTGTTAAVRRSTLRRIDELHADGIVTADERTTFIRLVEAHLPPSAARGVVHGDFCATNLVVTPDGALVSIDNERVRVHFLDHDLARTWTRWAMTPQQERTFLDRYFGHGRARPSVATSEAWRICTTVKSASTLGRTPRTGPGLARKLVGRLTADLGAGTAVSR